MAAPLRIEVEQIKEQPEVKQALKQTTSTESPAKPAAQTKDKLWLGTHGLLFIGLAVLYFVLQFKVLRFAQSYVLFLHKLMLGAMAIVLLLAIAKTVDVYLIGRIDNAAS